MDTEKIPFCSIEQHRIGKIFHLSQAWTRPFLTIRKFITNLTAAIWWQKLQSILFKVLPFLRRSSFCTLQLRAKSGQLRKGKQNKKFNTKLEETVILSGVIKFQVIKYIFKLRKLASYNYLSPMMISRRA